MFLCKYDAGMKGIALPPQMLKKQIQADGASPFGVCTVFDFKEGQT